MQPSSNIEKNGELLYRWVENRVEVTKLRFKAGNIKLFTTFTKILLPALCLFITVLFLSAGIVWLLNETLHSSVAGYFIVAAFYLVMALLLYIFREPLVVKPLSNLLLKSIEDAEI